MPFVVTEACILCKYTDCVSVCPMDCFREGPNFLVIDPTACIDCSVCVPECPVDAIVESKEVADHLLHFVELNAQLAKDPCWKPITKSKAPMEDHMSWAKVKVKRQHLAGNGRDTPLPEPASAIKPWS
jgi:ferredoxin